jgi:hypothetical protein
MAAYSKQLRAAGLKNWILFILDSPLTTKLVGNEFRRRGRLRKEYQA